MRILNSQSRQKEEFTPLNAQRVTMYTCGPTVYDSLHLGHARAAITPDVVRRYLEYKGYNVRFVMNFTDVDDKIIKRAIAENTDYRQITARYIDEFHRVMQSLNVKPADVFPRATDHIPEMIEIVAKLIEKKHAYVSSDGDVYFDTSTYERYGALSGRKLDEEEAGLSGRIDQARLAVKKNQGDFVLWKLNKNDKEEIAKGGALVPRWPSPWGEGRPGWHLECSAMSRAYLGVPFDIHCGGQDLLFPHHEDEKAQTECAYCDELKHGESVKYWVHNAFVTVKARPEDASVSGDLVDAATGAVKMSKSLGNVKWLREMIWPEGPYDPMAIRMMLLSSHYRSPIVFEPAMLDEATARLERIYNTLEKIETALAATYLETQGENLELEAAFQKAMDDDFNTAQAISVIFDLCTAANQELTKNMRDTWNQFGPAHIRKAIVKMLNVLGIRPTRAKAAAAGDSEKLIELLMQSRQDARAAKQYQLGDKIRDGIKALGYEVEDLPGGKWAVKKK
ncbi:MAG TPA: cysteine--tRNA ligase [Planctomycetota bacterium]|nr:cysteine--tRNA ligase [Planctomycetota bacterium]